MGLHDRRHLRLDATGRGQDAVLFPLGLHERDARPRSGVSDFIGWYIFIPADPSRRFSSPIGSTRCSRTRPPRRKRRPKKCSSPNGRSRWETSARSLLPSRRRHGLHPVRRRQRDGAVDRERINELGVLKTLDSPMDGFSARAAQSCATAVIGGGLGLLLVRAHRAGRPDRRVPSDLPFPAPGPRVRNVAGPRCWASAPACAGDAGASRIRTLADPLRRGMTEVA